MTSSSWLLILPLSIIVTGGLCALIAAVLERYFGVNLNEFTVKAIFLGVGIVVLGLVCWIFYRWSKLTDKPSSKK